MPGSKAVVDALNQDVEASNTITDTSASVRENIGAGAVADDDSVAVAVVQGPTDVPDEARSRGIAHIFMMMCLIMAVSLVASNATILGTVRVAFYQTLRPMLTDARPYLPLLRNSTQCKTWGGIQQHISSQGNKISLPDRSMRN